MRERLQRKGAEAVGVDPGGAYIRRIGDIIARTRSSRILIDESRASNSRVARHQIAAMIE